LDDYVVRHTRQQAELVRAVRDVEAKLDHVQGATDVQAACLAELRAELLGLNARLPPHTPTRRNWSGRIASLLRKFLARPVGFVSRVYATAILFVLVGKNRLFDDDYYLSQAADVESSGIDPLFHYLWYGWREGRNPHPLFDTNYYLRSYPDVTVMGKNPLLHYLRWGWREGRNPHPLFDTNRYLEQAPELQEGKTNPVVHYELIGWRKGLQPHWLFDGPYYLAQYPDVEHSGMNPLIHFVRYGDREGRRPHQWFHSSFYRASYPDVERSGMGAMSHYLRYGAAEGRDPHLRFNSLFYCDENRGIPLGMSPLEHYLRVGVKRNAPTLETMCTERFLQAELQARTKPIPGELVDIIVPVYRGLHETKACIDSLLASRNEEPYELMVINDRSPELELSRYLTQSAAEGHFTLIENDANLGFAGTVNRGMLLHPGRDVVLLNSDTMVSNNWLDRLVACAHSSGRIGTVTPLSNNATICSYPIFCANNALPTGTTTEELDLICGQVNAGRSIDIPTAVGFCMYIRRDCLEETGLFDEKAFGAGYGEENDFSLRAASLGWRNLLSADVFVYHAGAVSFSGSSFKLRQSATRALCDRHPGYEALVKRHVRRDPGRPYRLAVTAHRFRTSGKPVILFVSHAFGGGVERHIRDLTEQIGSGAHLLKLQPGKNGTTVLTGCDPADGVSLEIHKEEYYTLVRILQSCGVTRLHVHHVMGHNLDVEKLQNDLKVPLDFTIHDYFSICPFVNLADQKGRYCGEPDEAGCNQCIHTRSPSLGLDIVSWRKKYAWAVNAAERVISPSLDVATRMKRYFPEARLVASAHPSTDAFAASPLSTILSYEPLRVAILGVMVSHKGMENLRRCAELARDTALPVEFTLIGSVDQQARGNQRFAFAETGEYSPDELSALLANVRPHVVWFPVRSPETFSFTLSECLKRGLPVVAPDIGSFPERLEAREWTWIYPWQLEPEALLELFLSIRENIKTGTPPELPPSMNRVSSGFYRGDYLHGGPGPVHVKGRSSNTELIALLASNSSGQLQACGYVRGYLPFTHPALRGLIHLTVATPYSAARLDGDVLLVQRTTIPNLQVAQEVVDSCQARHIQIVYETDDDLFDVPENHPENSFYRPYVEAAKYVIQHASVILVSSPALRNRLEALHSDIRVIPNALDERLWLAGTHRRRRDSKGPVRILYMGTPTHLEDLQMLEEPLRELKREFGAGVELDVIGIVPESYRREWFNVVSVPDGRSASYPLFVSWLRALNGWHVGVAPLVDNHFNRCKSYIKYLDYAALGLPGVFTSNGVFDGVVKNGETGLLVDNEATAWKDALRLLVQDSDLRRQIGKSACADVTARHTLDAQSAWRRNVWRQIVNHRSSRQATHTD
jgi:GT2 family glycosyltransferase/glycosyltransferase involved in cell wall biosynthesis